MNTDTTRINADKDKPRINTDHNAD